MGKDIGYGVSSTNLSERNLVHNLLDTVAEFLERENVQHTLIMQ
jgi:hypothetical protein